MDTHAIIILDKLAYDFISLWIRLKLMTLKAFGFDDRMIGFNMELDQFEDTWGAKYPLLVKSWRQNWEEMSTFSLRLFCTNLFWSPRNMSKIVY
ncbi:hypothetical protein UB51_11110 [Paenibacillus sp. IHBB 10380]|nr:hypothetical protein UB51_11110 [Paenibacillus sp. IHBB 10380]